MTPLFWKLRSAAEWLGWRGLLGGTLLLASVIMAATAVPARIGDLHEAEAEVEGLRARLKLSGPNARKGGGTREDQLANFYAFFPGATTLPDWLERIYAAAERAGVKLEAGEYKLVQERNWKLDRYQVTLPVRGSYAQVRRFMAEVLGEIPVASLDEVGFRRDAVGSAVLDARVRLTVYMGHK